MPERGGNARNRHRGAKPPSPPWLRPMTAVLAVLLVLMPVTWLLLRNGLPGLGTANPEPYGTWDDKFPTPTIPDPDSMPSESMAPTDRPTRRPGKSPSPTTSTPPAASPTPADSPSSTTAPTIAPTVDRVSTRPSPTKPIRPPSQRPPDTPDTPSVPPDDGNMTPDERELFNLIDQARIDHGCAPLRPSSGLSDGARRQAGDQARSRDYSPDNSSETVAGGDGDLGAQDAFDQMMRNDSQTVLDCGFTRLGVGRGTAEHCAPACLGPIGRSEDTGWVADFS